MRALILLTALALVLPACATPKGTSDEEKRQYVREMRDDSRRRFLEADPGLQSRMRNAYGYAVFSNVSPKIFLLSPGHGYGMAVQTSTGREIFMRMASLGAGPGLGIVNQTTLFVFKNKDL